jgi:citrate lyase beta subunit
MHFTIPSSEKDRVFQDLKIANTAFNLLYPGDKIERQPVHTVYGGANLFKSDTTKKMGVLALNHFRTYAKNFGVLAKALQIKGFETLPESDQEIHELSNRLSAMSATDQKKHPAWLSWSVYQKVAAKLEREAVEDFRIDFEDGFGNRSDEEEDATAIFAAQELAKGMADETISPFIGIRIKPFTEDMKVRGIRTMDLFLTTLLESTGGKLPENFVIMLPKVTIPEQMEAMVRLFEAFEQARGLPMGTLKMEMMVEATQAVMDAEGRNPLLRLIRAAKGRCIAAHFGTYDYTASCNITAKYQTMAHPVCDFAHHMTRVALGHTGIMLSDGATNVMPVGPHRGPDLTIQQEIENREVVHKAWKMGFDHTMHSLIHGFYQGWDLNPAQLPMRYAATYVFFLDSYEDAAWRLKNFVEKAAQATLLGDVFDDAATGQGLLNYFLKAMNCGAISEEEALVTGLSLDEIRGRSFYRILQGRRGKMV